MTSEGGESVVELAEGSDAAVDPMTLRLVRGQVDEHDKVSGVAGRGQDAAPRTRLVDGTGINLLLFKICL